MSSEQGPHALRIAVVTVFGFAAIAAAMYVYWPAGVAVGLVAGITAIVVVGRRMQAQQAQLLRDVDDPFGFADDADVDAEIFALRSRLGFDYRDFARAALAVTRAQWAAPEVLQHEMGVSPERARRLLILLEEEGFVGASVGTRERPVLVGAESESDLARLLRV